MLPHLPHALDPDFNSEKSAENGVAVPQHGSDDPDVSGAEHHCQICPTCGHLLTGHRCKLVCTQCGYYMSCADYY